MVATLMNQHMSGVSFGRNANFVLEWKLKHMFTTWLLQKVMNYGNTTFNQLKIIFKINERKKTSWF